MELERQKPGDSLDGGRQDGKAEGFIDSLRGAVFEEPRPQRDGLGSAGTGAAHGRGAEIQVGLVRDGPNTEGELEKHDSKTSKGLTRQGRSCSW